MMRAALGGAVVAPLLAAAPAPAEAYRWAPRSRRRAARARVPFPRPPPIRRSWKPGHLNRYGEWVPGHWR